MAIEYKIFELTWGPNSETEYDLNLLAKRGFKISHVIPGFVSNGGTNHFPKLILEKYIPDDTTPYR